MIRNVSAIMLCLALLLGACKPAPAPAPTPTEEPSGLPTPEPITGRLSFMVFGDPAEKAAYEKLLDSFRQTYPGMDVRLLYVPDESAYVKRLAADFAAGTPADVVLLDYRQYASFAARGVLAPLAPYLAQAHQLRVTDFYPEALIPFYWHGVLTCIPQSVSGTVVYYNKDLFEQSGVPFPRAGWTWDDFLAAAAALTKADQGQYGAAIPPSFAGLAPFIWQNAGDLVFNPDAPTRLSLDKPEAMQALQWFVDLQVKHHVVPGAVEEQSEDGLSRFQNGRAAMYFGGRRLVPSLRQVAAFDWDVAPLPAGKVSASLLQSDGYCMSASSANKRGAWALIEFANSAAGQALIAATGRSVPSLKSVAASPAFMQPDAKPAGSQVFLDAIPHLHAMPIMSTWIDIEAIVDSEVERAFYGNATAQDAVASANARAVEFLKLAVELQPTPLPNPPGSTPTPIGGARLPDCASHVATVPLVQDFPADFPFPPGSVFLQSYAYPETHSFYTLAVTPMAMADAVKYYQDSLSGTGYVLLPGDAEPGEVDMVLHGNGRTGNLRTGIPLGCESVTIVEITFDEGS